MTELLNVPGLLWQNFGKKLEEGLKSSKDIIQSTHLDFTVSAHPMGCDLQEKVGGYHAVYRDDTQIFLGVVNSRFPQFVQNVDSFRMFDRLLENNSVKLDTVSYYKGGRSVFAVFKVNTQFKVVDDDFENYFIVVNDHLKPDGKVLILNTPVRIVCQNALSYALGKSVYQLRVESTDNDSSNIFLGNQLLQSVKCAITAMNQRANSMLKKKISDEKFDYFLDQMFPLPEDTDREVAYENVSYMRNKFSECMHADNLANYNNTVYQLYNALTDFYQHYFKDYTKAYDLTYRMSMLPNFSPTPNPQVGDIKKFLKLIPELAA